MAAIAERMARGPARIQLKYKDPGSWQEFVARLRQLSPQGLAYTMARCQAMRPSLHELRDQLAEMTIPVLLAVGDEDAACLETNLMLKSVLPNAGLWLCPIPAMASIWKSPRHSTLKLRTSWALLSAVIGAAEFQGPNRGRSSDCSGAHPRPACRPISITSGPMLNCFAWIGTDRDHLRLSGIST
jgi:hypothetical protein